MLAEKRGFAPPVAPAAPLRARRGDRRNCTFLAFPSRHTHVAPKTKGRIQRHRWWRAPRPRTCTPRQPRGDEARAVEFGRRQNHLRWGHRRSGLRLGVMEGHSDHQSGLLCVGSLGSEVSAPGPRGVRQCTPSPGQDPPLAERSVPAQPEVVSALRAERGDSSMLCEAQPALIVIFKKS